MLYIVGLVPFLVLLGGPLCPGRPAANWPRQSCVRCVGGLRCVRVILLILGCFWVLYVTTLQDPVLYA